MSSSISTALVSSVHPANNPGSMVKSAEESGNFGSLFSEALLKNKAQLESALNLGQSGLGQYAPSSLRSTLNQNRQSALRETAPQSNTMLNNSISESHEATIQQTQHVRKSQESKKSSYKTHNTESDHLNTNPGNTNNVDPTPAANAQAVPTHAPDSDPSATPSSNSESGPGRTELSTQSPSLNQQAFLEGRLSGASANGNTHTELGDSAVMVNLEGFSQFMNPSIQNISSNLSNSLSSAGALSSMGLTTASSSARSEVSAQENALMTDSASFDTSALANEDVAPINTPTNGNPRFALTPALGEGPWAAALGQQALFIAKNQMGSAQLTLNPEHLGPIQVTLDMKHDQATAVFVTSHEAVRQAIEASLPQLRDMFTQAGLNLGHAQVQSDLNGQFAQSSQHNQDQTANRSDASSRMPIGEDLNSSSLSSSSLSRVSRGLLDTFA